MDFMPKGLIGREKNLSKRLIYLINWFRWYG